MVNMEYKYFVGKIFNEFSKMSSFNYEKSVGKKSELSIKYILTKYFNLKFEFVVLHQGWLDFVLEISSTSSVLQHKMFNTILIEEVVLSG